MVREGDAFIEAYYDAKKGLPNSLQEALDTGAVWANIPYPADFSAYIPFAVFGVKPVDELGHWHGCIEVEYPNTSIRVRLFHRFNMETERRVVMIWDSDHENEGHIVAVEDFTVMKDFFRIYRENWRTKSVRSHAN